ncbi:MAG: hypothetical protein LUC83_10335 [Clostridiales bacterium]|nr:hypothetical protein [Clostridiales bacterium]
MTDIVRQNNAWPEWKLVRQIGRCSYGRVYEAVRSDFQMKNRAAIKVISIPQDEVAIFTSDEVAIFLHHLTNYFFGSTI